MVDTTIQVAKFRPMDVTYFRSRDAAAAVLLANSMGWRIQQRENGPVALVAEDGKQIRVPDNTSIKSDVFRSWVHQIAVHSPGQSIDRKLIDEIVKTTKLERSHARLMYDLVEDFLPDDFGPVIEPITADEPLPKGGAYIVSEEPYATVKGKVSDSIIERTWSDGTKDYACAHCPQDDPLVAKHPKGVTAHQQFHIRRGEIPGKTIKAKPGSTRRTFISADEPRNASGKLVSRQSTIIQVEREAAEAGLEAMRVLEKVRELLGPSENVSALKRSIEELEHKVYIKEERIAHLEGSLHALRELLAGDL